MDIYNANGVDGSYLLQIQSSVTIYIYPKKVTSLRNDMNATFIKLKKYRFYPKIQSEKDLHPVCGYVGCL
jgi:hypothetical protein